MHRASRSSSIASTGLGAPRGGFAGRTASAPCLQPVVALESRGTGACEGGEQAVEASREASGRLIDPGPSGCDGARPRFGMLTNVVCRVAGASSRAVKRCSVDERGTSIVSRQAADQHKHDHEEPNRRRWHESGRNRRLASAARATGRSRALGGAEPLGAERPRDGVLARSRLRSRRQGSPRHRVTPVS